MENEKPEPELVACIDLDGSACDYNGGMKTAMESMRSPGEPTLDGPDPFHDAPPWLEARMEYVKNRPGFWYDLNPIPLGMEVIDLIREVGYSLMILSKGPKKAVNAWSEKVQWAFRYIPDALVTLTQDKGGSYGRVLFDDWPPYILRWLKWRPRGLVLMLDQPWNQEHEGKPFEHPNVIRIKSAEDFPRVRAALELRKTQ